MSKDLIDYTVNGDLKGVKECIKNGADINVITDEGHTALSIASEFGHIDVVEYLESARAKE